MVVVVAQIIAAVPWLAGETRHAKIGVEVGCPGRGAIVIAGCQAVGHVGRVEEIPGGVGVRPFRCGGSSIDVVAQAGNVDNVLGCLIVYNPVHLGVINGWIGGGVKLGVGDGDEREVGSRRRLKRTPIEGDVKRLSLGVGDCDRERGVRRDVGCAICRRDQNRRFRREVDRGVERRARHPAGACPGDRAVDGVAGGIVHGRPGGFIEFPAADEAGLRIGEFGVDGADDLRLCAHNIPNTRFIEYALEIAGAITARRSGRSTGLKRRAKRGMLCAVPARVAHRAHIRLTVQYAIEVELPVSAVIGDSRVIPGVILYGCGAFHRVIKTVISTREAVGRLGCRVALFDICHKMVRASLDAEEVVHILRHAIVFGHALGHERNRFDPAAAGITCYTRPCFLEPGFDGEGLDSQSGACPKVT